MEVPTDYADPAVVRRTYDRIATHFAQTRDNPWPEVSEFVESNTTVEVALDIGCANGRHAELLAARARRVIGIDTSRVLLEAACARGDENSFQLDAIQADATSVPLLDDSIDLAVYVATLHHLPNRDRRIQSLDELARVLSPDGCALISTWSTAHDRFDATEGFDTTIDWTLPDGVSVPRFYHIYDPVEFERDIEESSLRTLETRISSGNCYATVKSGGQA